MSQAIAVFSNRRSRQNRMRPELLLGLKRTYAGRADFFEPEDMEALRRDARRALEMGYRYLAINGGDGTTHQVLTAFEEVRGDLPFPRIALLRGGTMNNVTDSFRIRGTPKSILGRLCDVVSEGVEPTLARRCALAVSDGSRRRLGFIFGTGLMASFLKEYYAEGETSPVTAAWMAARLCTSVAVQGELYRKLSGKIHHRLQADGELWLDKDLICLMCATTEEIGLRLAPFSSAGRHTDRFSAVAVEGPMMAIVTALPAIWRASEMTMRGFEERLPQKLELSLPGIFDYTMDGDLYEASKLSLSLGPELAIFIP